MLYAASHLHNLSLMTAPKPRTIKCNLKGVAENQWTMQPGLAPNSHLRPVSQPSTVLGSGLFMPDNDLRLWSQCFPSWSLTVPPGRILPGDTVDAVQVFGSPVMLDLVGDGQARKGKGEQRSKVSGLDSTRLCWMELDTLEDRDHLRLFHTAQGGCESNTHAVYLVPVLFLSTPKLGSE